MTDADHVRVLVVGGGPVGLATAMELVHHGIEVTLVEPRETVSYLRPRAKTTNARTMELFRRWGLASTLRERAPMKVDWSKDIVFCTTVTGREITRLTGVLGLTLGLDDTAAEAGQQVPQPIVEETLREALEASGRASLLFGWKVALIEPAVAGVVVTVENAQGDTQTIEAEYVIGADGPRSAVRTAMGAEYEGTSLPRPNVSITFRSEQLGELIPVGPAVQYWVLNPTAPGIVGRLDLTGTWWAISTARPETGVAALEPVEIVTGLLGADIPLTVIATDPWLSRTLISNSYRAGRMFIVGDAAHQNPPWGGHGFNTGVGDGVNLGWKLAAVLNGWAPAELLDSYESERRPVAARFVAAAAENGKTNPNALAVPELMGGLEQFAAVQPSLATAIQESKRIEFHSDGLVFGMGYGGNSEGQTTTGSDYIPIAASGNRLPHRWLGEGDSLFDRLGRELTVIGNTADVAPLVGEAAARRIPLAVVGDDVIDPVEAFGARAVLVRPDQHIAWLGDAVTDADSVLTQALLGFR